MTKGELTRKRIVEAAASIFNQHGYAGSSLNALVEATGLKKGGIYRHFSGKEELAAKAFDYTLEAAWKARILHVDEKADGIDKLKQLIENFVECRSPVPGGCPVLNTRSMPTTAIPCSGRVSPRPFVHGQAACRPTWKKLSSNTTRNPTSTPKPRQPLSWLLSKALS
jgi:AcrR family transcriptional regulator